MVASRAAMAIEVSARRVVATAELARLALRDDEVAPLAAQLERVLGFIAALDEVEGDAVTDDVDVGCRRRGDVVVEGLSRDEALSQAPRAEQGAFVVPQFVEG